MVPSKRIPDQKTSGKETTMKLKDMTMIVALVLVAGFVALTLSLSAGAASVSATSEQDGRLHQLHAVKECADTYTGKAGDYCTITSSNLKQIPNGSRLYYDQAFGITTAFGTPLLDSNVVLDDGTGHGNRAVGRCTLDGKTNLGLCTFSDGTGELTGFEARVLVSCPGRRTNKTSCSLDGTYSFSPQPSR
jgi:hypothetical protein